MHPLLNSPEPLSPTPVPSGLTEFVLPDGAKFRLDLVEAHRALNRLAEAHQHDQDGQHLEAFAKWIQQETGGQLRTAQAEWLWDHVLMERAAAKKNFADVLKSLTSTASTPAE